MMRMRFEWDRTKESQISRWAYGLAPKKPILLAILRELELWFTKYCGVGDRPYI